MRMKIIGTGSALPQAQVDNSQMAEWVDTTDAWIRERTGIGERRLSTGETVASLAAEACLKALEQAGRKAEEVDLILLATCSAEYLCPSAACQVQAAIGAVNANAFDINAACSGFVFGLNMAQAYIQSGMYSRILIVGSEVLTKMTDWNDRGTCVLFGDGAGAALVEAHEEGDSRMLGCIEGADGTKGMVLNCRSRMIDNPLFQEDMEKAGGLHLSMDGREVYCFATRQVADCINQVLKKTELKVEDIDLFVLHQANVRIIEAVAKKLHADLSLFPINLDRVGNMSSATIPVLLDDLNREGRLHRGDKLVLSGFGGGLTYGASVLIW